MAVPLSPFWFLFNSSSPSSSSSPHFADHFYFTVKRYIHFLYSFPTLAQRNGYRRSPSLPTFSPRLHARIPTRLFACQEKRHGHKSTRQSWDPKILISSSALRTAQGTSSMEMAKFAYQCLSSCGQAGPARTYPFLHSPSSQSVSPCLSVSGSCHMRTDDMFLHL